MGVVNDHWWYIYGCIFPRSWNSYVLKQIPMISNDTLCMYLFQPKQQCLWKGHISFKTWTSLDHTLCTYLWLWIYQWILCFINQSKIYLNLNIYIYIYIFQSLSFMIYLCIYSFAHADHNIIFLPSAWWPRADSLPCPGPRLRGRSAAPGRYRQPGPVAPAEGCPARPPGLHRRHGGLVAPAASVPMSLRWSLVVTSYEYH